MSKTSVNRGVLIGSIAIFISFLGATLTFPFLQAQRDKFECDALCYGSMQSVRSGLSMVGTVMVGRMSDRLGRALALWIGTFASLLSYLINYYGNSMTAVWIALIPPSLLNQNFSVLKALFADYGTEFEFSEAERASAVGRLGMAVGVSFMLGPVIGAQLLSNYNEATLAALCLTLFSAVCLLFLPVPNMSAKPKEEGKRPEVGVLQQIRSAIVGFFYMPAVQTPGARLLLFMRCAMGLAFSVFMTVWTVSLKSRFDFGPKDHAYFMGWIGLWYALSQGVIARESIRLSGNNPTNLLLLCVVGLSVGRVAAMTTDSLYMVYFIMAAVIIALGVMNTAMASACTHLAGRDQVGGLYGVIDAFESLAGLVGPTLGGLLFKYNPLLPIAVVVLMYALVFVAVYLYYHKHIICVDTEARDKGDKALEISVSPPGKAEKPREKTVGLASPRGARSSARGSPVTVATGFSSSGSSSDDDCVASRLRSREDKKSR
ncbi:major facilitator superfamily domain-containing protein [Ochromonadaceae sp. CCMP2298]|nr:major facilitator superfamily domain-containing protein [Ochromonadaceae sp. CCMP2298]|mmetsp:Transcript_1065/g.2370  ORF Transcript_1065/g.2370 Transcript_1065/m.2370 type:complete len:488 (+) Transcript_1065:153-1616(+)|eukprot:CAMPEP_0173190378 /NCGR_PEP_ID=MMETSP1141-20130122/12313_1 /TAXON_ID=483371 /ORGANISM="non described non described, Strain CCMP2298" /LENGTH=487 /DNA_ID=CAMNT_0014114483 /DNA_START=67 /DNA_END=1530 /DNA_ORIENTATION=-